MQKMRFSLIAAALLLLGACNNIDSAFVEKMQTGVSKAQENRASFEASAQTTTQLLKKMVEAPVGLKNNPRFGYVELYTEVTTLNKVYASMITMQDQMASRMEAIMGEYTDGKVKKESVLQESQELMVNFDGYHGRIEMIGKRLEAASAKYDQMMADWAAAPESEKIASASMPAPVLPDAATERSSSPLPISQPAAGSSQPAQPGALAPAAAPNATSPSATAPSAPTPSSSGALSPKPDGKKQ
jgi:hypothetical protein